VAPRYPCGSFVGEGGEDLNYFLRRAGAVCCNDASSQCMGLDVHVVSAEMTLNMSFSGMSEDQLAEALKQAIVAQIGDPAESGINVSDVGNITISVKVKGTAPMTMADPQAFMNNEEAKTAVKQGLATQTGAEVSDITTTFTVEGASADTGEAAADTDESATTSNSTDEPSRRLQGVVNVDYEIETDLSAVDALTAELQAESAADSLTTAINAELEDVEGVDPVTVDEIEAEQEVTISYQIRTTDATAAAGAQTALAESASAPTSLTTSLEANLLAQGVTVTIHGMTAEVGEVDTEDTGEDAAAPSSPISSNAFRLGHHHAAVAAVVALALAQL